jgi:hypothetical protein
MKLWLMACVSFALLAGCRSGNPVMGPTTLPQNGAPAAGLIGLDAATMKGGTGFQGASAAKSQATASAACEPHVATDAEPGTNECL